MQKGTWGVLYYNIRIKSYMFEIKMADKKVWLDCVDCYLANFRFVLRPCSMPGSRITWGGEPMSSSPCHVSQRFLVGFGVVCVGNSLRGGLSSIGLRSGGNRNSCLGVRSVTLSGPWSYKSSPDGSGGSRCALWS